MARLRIETAPEITVYDEAFVIKAAANATAPLVQLKDSSGAVVGNISSNGTLNVASVVAANAGTSSTDLATRGYVDTVASGMNWHSAADFATAAALPACTYANGTLGVGATLTGDSNGRLTVDGSPQTTGKSVLVKNQTDAKQNGIYYITAQGNGSTPFVLTRRSDADNNIAGQVKAGDAIYVVGGSNNAGQAFTLTSTGTGTGGAIVLGTDNLSYTQFTGTSTFTAGAGLLATGNVVDVVTASTNRIVVNADSIDLATVTQSNTSGANTTSFISGHTVDSYGRITGTQTSSVSFDGYATLASPALTGVPTAPTAAIDTANTQIATTAYVVNQIADDAILKTVANAKGDIFTATADNTPAILTVGTDSQVLVANSLATSGLTWATVSPTVSLSGDVSGSGTLTNLGNASISVSIGSGKVTSAMIVDGTIVNGDISTSAAIAHSKLANATAGQVLLGTTTTGVVTATTLSGDVTIDGGGVTAIGSGVIVNADINASAAIDKTKISGTAITAADTGTVTSAMIADGTIVNGDVSTSAAIALSKLASGTSAQVIVANSTGVPTYVSLSGDVTVTNAGVTALAPNITISNNLIVSGNLTVSGTTTTINTATLSVADNIVTLNSDFTTGSPTENAGVEVLRGSSATVALRWNETNDKWESTNDGTTYGNIVTTADSGTVTSTMIADGTIVNGDINASAAIAYSKLNLATSIVNADISTTAAIALSKLASGTAGQVILANAGGVPTYVTPSGDVSWDSAGNIQIVANTIVNADINSAAAIAYSKLNLSGSIVNADISATAAIDQGKIADTVINAQTTSYTLVLTDKNKMVEVSNAGATTLTIPADNTVNMATGATLTILQTGAGQVTIAGAAGVTVNATPGLKLRTQWSSATLIKRAANTWIALGDLSA